MNPYILSFTRKFDHYFDQKEILNMIYLHDEEDNERLDHVFFLEQVDGGVAGIYVRGMNPLILGSPKSVKCWGTGFRLRRLLHTRRKVRVAGKR